MEESEISKIPSVGGTTSFPPTTFSHIPFSKEYHRYARILIQMVQDAVQALPSAQQTYLFNQISLKIDKLPQSQDFLDSGTKIDTASFTPQDFREVIQKLTYKLFQQIFFYNLIKYTSHHHYGIYVPALITEKFENLDIAPNNQKFSIPSGEIFTPMKHRISELIQSFEFAPIFHIHESLIDLWELLAFPQIQSLLFDFNQTCERFDFERISESNFNDLIQRIIPTDEQKNFGQVYTPDYIADFMVNLAITSPDQVVLDPACGCGVFLSHSYDHLKHLKQIQLDDELPSSLSVTHHVELLHQIWGVELNNYPAHLGMLKLALKDLSSVTDEVGILIEDFLALGPLQKYMVHTKDLKSGDIISREMPHKFDVVIANPPYIKQEQIPNKTEMMANLPIFASYRKENIYKENYSKLLKKVPLGLSAKTDYYGFFLWYSTFFLKQHGTLCFLIPDKWMDVKYGEKIKSFLKNHYIIHAIIGFNQNIFEHAQVSTVIILATRLDTNLMDLERNQNIVKFFLVNSEKISAQLTHTIKQPISSEILQYLNQKPYYFENMDESYSCTYVQQELLEANEKWTYKYLYQSQFYFKLLQSPHIFLHNHNITEVVGGLKTGANAFFFPSRKDVKEYHIESAILKAGIKSGRNIPMGYIVQTPPNSFIDVPSTLALAEYPGLHQFIQYCQDAFAYQDRPSVKWKPWFSIPKKNQDIPDILFLRHINQDFRALWNYARCITADGIRGIRVTQPAHLLFYLGVCNSRFFYWQAHVEGRWEGQGDLQLLVYELKNFRIPDVSLQSPEIIQEVENSIIHLMLSDPHTPTDLMKSCLNSLFDLNHYENKNLTHHNQPRNRTYWQKRLDIAVLSALGLKNEYDLMISELQWLETKRITKKFD